MADAITLRRHAMTILWPAFLAAGAVEMLVFAFVDPRTLHWLGGAQVELSAPAVYTLAFFAFWLMIAAAGAVSRWLELSADDVNRPR